MKRRLKQLGPLALVACLTGIFWQAPAAAYTANKVWFTFLRNGRYRVNVVYTIPALKEFRESYVEFIHKKDAEAFYWSVIRGADFYPDAQQTRYNQTAQKPDPW